MSQVEVIAKMNRRFFAQVLRTAALSLAMALMIPATACNRESEKIEEEMAAKFAEEEAEVAAERRPLEEQEAVVAEFAADGLWHPLPYSAHSGQAFQIETFGPTKNFGDNLVEFRIAGRTMMVTDGNPFLVSQSGSLEVRVRLQPGLMLGPSAQIQITRIK